MWKDDTTTDDSLNAAIAAYCDSYEPQLASALFVQGRIAEQFESPENLSAAVFRGNEDIAFETIIAEIAFARKHSHLVALEKAVHALLNAVEDQARAVAQREWGDL